LMRWTLPETHITTRSSGLSRINTKKSGIGLGLPAMVSGFNLGFT